MTDSMTALREFYWTHREVIRLAAVAASFAMVQLVLVLWTLRRTRELGHIRERLSRLADGLALLTDTTEAGLATLAREVESLGRRRQAAAPPPRKPAPRPHAKRAAARRRPGAGPVPAAAIAAALMTEANGRPHPAVQG